MTIDVQRSDNKETPKDNYFELVVATWCNSLLWFVLSSQSLLKLSFPLLVLGAFGHLFLHWKFKFARIGNEGNLTIKILEWTFTLLWIFCDLLNFVYLIYVGLLASADV